MKKLLAFLSICILLCSCHKADVLPDYDQIIGRYRCVFIVKSYNDSSGNLAIDIIYPDAEYTIEFKKNRKVIMSKSGERVMDRKLIRCEAVYDPGFPRWDIQLKGEESGHTMLFKQSLDTCWIGGNFFPGSYYYVDGVDEYYEPYFVKED